MNKVSVVILNYNGKSFLERFLPNVIQYSNDIADIIVADNASTDDSVSFLNEKYPQVRLIQNKSNSGFSTGYNEALKLIDSEYYVLLNSDIEVTQNWISPVIKLMDSDKTIAVCQPKIRSYHEKDKFEYAGAGGGFIDKFGYPFCRGRLFNTLEKDEGQYNDSCEVFWATGACMFVRADFYHRYGGLEDSFFAHMEEIDFCWRMKNLGYRIMYCADSVIYHIGGGTLPKSSSRKTYLNFRNNLSLLLKNLPTNQVIPILLFRLSLDVIAGLKFLVEGGFTDFFAVFHAQISFAKRVPMLLKKRKLVKPQTISMIYKKNIVFEYFILKKQHFKDLHQSDFS